MAGSREVFRILLLTLVARQAWSDHIRERRVYSAGFDAAYGSSRSSHHVLHDQQDKECLKPASIDNARKRCLSSGCRIRCNKGYKTSGDASSTRLYCNKTTGKYTLNGQPWNASIPICRRECQPACLNGGTCLARGLCQCPRGFWGPQCQVRRCVFPARVFNHTSIGGTLRRLKVECHAGHQMASGRVVQVLVCQKGEWLVPPAGELLQDHDFSCYPVCKPACGKEGRCTAPNHCSYPGDNHCEHQPPTEKHIS